MVPREKKIYIYIYISVAILAQGVLDQGHGQLAFSHTPLAPGWAGGLLSSLSGAQGLPFTCALLVYPPSRPTASNTICIGIWAGFVVSHHLCFLSLICTIVFCAWFPNTSRRPPTSVALTRRSSPCQSMARIAPGSLKRPSSSRNLTARSDN